MSDFIVTASGRKFYPLMPLAADIWLEDVAHQLAKVARWTGATKGDEATYSVAQHAVYVSYMCQEAEGGTPLDGLWGLHHDDSEAYMADIARPVKHSPEFKAYRDAERRLMYTVCNKFALPFDMPASVHAADYNMLVTEYRDLMPHLPATDPDANWHYGFAGAYDFKLFPERIWKPKFAREMFIKRHYELGGK